MSALFTPARLGDLVVPNRFVRSATAERMADENGRPRDVLSELYRALAEGGATSAAARAFDTPKTRRISALLRRRPGRERACQLCWSVDCVRVRGATS